MKRNRSGREMCCRFALMLACLSLWATTPAGLMQREERPRYAAGHPSETVPESGAMLVFPPVTSEKIAPPEREIVLALAAQHKARSPTPPTRTPARATNGNQSYAVIHLEFTDAEAQRAFNWPSGLTPFARFERFADAFLRLDAQTPALLHGLNRAAGLVWLELAQDEAVKLPPTLKSEPNTAKSSAELIVRGGWPDGKPLYTGRGVIIALVDTGLDFRNPDFITCDASGAPVSRLLYLWDTTQQPTPRNGQLPPDAPPRTPAPVLYPDGAPFGTVYTQAELTAALQTNSRARQVCQNQTQAAGPRDSAAGLMPRSSAAGPLPRHQPRSRPKTNTPAPRQTAAVNVGDTDTIGHGTACAGVAAGNGNNAPGVRDVLGVAPRADLIAVRAGADSLTNVYLLNAVAGWLDQVAGNQPLVLTASFNTQGGGHDGAGIAERQLDARFPSSVVGRALVLSAGNTGARGPNETRHAVLSLADHAQAGTLVFANVGTGADLSIYLDGDAPEDVAVLAQPVALARQMTRQTRWRNPLTQQAVLSFKLPKGLKSLTLYSLSGRRLRADAYLEGGNFDATAVNETGLVEKPGTARQAMTVGSYDWNEAFPIAGELLAIVPCDEKKLINGGGISYNSRPGPRRDGLFKPDLAAPGQFYRASYANHSQTRNVNMLRGDLTKKSSASCPSLNINTLDETGQYVLFDGTSAATAYTAGIIALMFEQRPCLSWGETKQLIQQNLTTDSRTGKTPNPHWGYGKLNIVAVKGIMADRPGEPQKLCAKRF